MLKTLGSIWDAGWRLVRGGSSDDDVGGEEEDATGPLLDDETAAIEHLLEGAPQRLGDVPRSTGGRAGVFTLWIDGKLLFLGLAKQSAEESAPTNKKQADGVRGRLVGIRRQPTKRLVKAITTNFAKQAKATGAADDAKRVAALLEKQGEFRAVRTVDGPAAVELHGAAKTWLAKHDLVPLADR
jgi:hypothetical protein